MPNWIPILILSNLELRAAIETEFALVAPPADDRVAALANDAPILGDFLNRFKSAFGRKVQPAVVLLREDAPKSFFQSEAISGLRDTLAISAIAVNRARQLNQGAARYFVWSNFFSVYPWMVASDNDGLTALTPAIGGVDDIKHFHGQSSPDVFVQPCDDMEFDRPLRKELLEKWHARYSTDSPSHKEIALFRSLNMAFAAAAIPSGREITYYDVGRQIALWISSFEILAHPGAGGKANLGTVYELLKQAPWHKGPSKLETHACYNGGQPALNSINACWLYGRLYQERNNFLHGNPVAIDNLRLPSGRNLIEIAAPLYRMALAAHLPVTFTEPAPDLKNSEATANHIGKLMRFYGPQDEIEEALLAAHEPPHD